MRSAPICLALLLVLTPAAAGATAPDCPRHPLVIAHRGASGDLPEHTLAAYEVAIQQGADVLEPDLVMSRDGVLLARHENEIGETTDVAQRAAFSERRARKRIDGHELEGWFSEDFDWDELAELRARERIPALRPANTRFDGQFPLVRFEEFLERVSIANRLRRLEDAQRGRPPRPALGIAPELKHPSHHRSQGLDPVEPLLTLLTRFGYQGREAPVWIQSFEQGVLRELRPRTELRLLQLMEEHGRPPDAAPGARDFAALREPEGLADVKQYADAIGIPKSLVLAAGGERLVRDAHAAGLEVHVWTLRAENHFLSEPFRSPGGPAERGDLAGEVRAVLARCVDAVFADHPFPAAQARDAHLAAGRRGKAD